MKMKPKNPLTKAGSKPKGLAVCEPKKTGNPYTNNGGKGEHMDKVRPNHKGMK